MVRFKKLSHTFNAAYTLHYLICPRVSFVYYSLAFRRLLTRAAIAIATVYCVRIWCFISSHKIVFSSHLHIHTHINVYICKYRIQNTNYICMCFSHILQKFCYASQVFWKAFVWFSLCVSVFDAVANTLE